MSINSRAGRPAKMRPQALAMLSWRSVLNLMALPIRPNRIGIMMKRHSQRTCFSICSNQAILPYSLSLPKLAQCKLTLLETTQVLHPELSLQQA